MEPTYIQNEIARQIDVQKPAHLVPGRDVSFCLVNEDAVGVIVHTDDTKALVKYHEGRDDYTVTVQRFNDPQPRILERIYVDMLGDLIFGSDAEPFTEPIVEIYIEGDDGEWTKVASI
jgi:hypothetical protein